MRRAAPAGLLCAALLAPQPVPSPRVGPADGGGFLLNSGWVVRPAGRSIPLETLPIACQLSPDGRFVLVLHAGYQQPSLAVFDAASLRQIDREPLEDAWLGLAFAPGGRLVYAGGGASANIYELALSEDGKLERQRTFSAVPRGEQKTDADFIGDVAVSPDGRLIYAAALFANEVRVINPQSGWVIERFPTPRRPYRLLFHPDGKSFYLTSWAEGSIHRLDSGDGRQLSMLRLGAQPMDMAWSEKQPLDQDTGAAPPWRARLFVAAANTNRVYVLGITESQDMRLIETINVAMWPRQPLGMTPSALALNADQTRLYVVCSDANAVAAVDIRREKSRVVGFLPAGWYPTDAAPLPGGRLVVLNGRGERSYPNPGGPNPLRQPAPPYSGSASPQYVAALQKGSATVFEPADDKQLFEWTKAALRLSPYEDRKLDVVPEPPESPLPRGLEAPAPPESPVKHVLYIVKENCSYDQVLGDLGKGHGDPSLAVFGEQVTPNHHKLAREFVLFDNFYALGDVDADGRSWSTAAIAPPFVQRLWPAVYAGRLKRYDFDAGELAALPAAGYLWTNALSAGLTVRNYGFQVANHQTPVGGIHVSRVLDPGLAKHTNRRFRGFDPDYPDVERAKVFLEDLAEMEETGQMPRLMVMHLGNDHTSGTQSGKLAPKSAMADNDYALGLIVEACSNSRFWPEMAIFVVEDDAQGGADHVDSHRAPAFILSPFTRRGIVDSTFYNTASVLRTIGLILGLRPMTQFDAAATPMGIAFQPEPDTTPYTAVKPRVPLDERNP